MAAVVTITGTFCSGGNHVDLAVDLNGQRHLTLHNIDVSRILDALTMDEKEAFVMTCLRLKKVGLTNAQLKSVVIAGFTVTV